MVVELSKPIKPKKLAVDQIRLNLLNALRKEGRIIAKEFEKTTRTWKGEKPKFEVLIGLTGKDATVVVGPSGSDKAILKWIWIEEGTKPHKIPKSPKTDASAKPFLIFREGFSPKTLPGKLGSFPSGSFGPWVRKRQVNHPGTEPRNFSKIVVKRRRKRFANNMIKAARIV
jgi:hypothetical protein